MGRDYKVKKYIKLLRIKHYIKNLLIFVPLFFSGKLFDRYKLQRGGLGFICFCLIASSIYILNDLKDIEKDRNHPTKKNRPLASGQIKPRLAIIIMTLCICVSCVISLYLENMSALIFLATYFGLNVAYSMGLKNKPIIDIVILASGFVIRIFYGGVVTNVPISKWLYLVVTVGSLYMGLGKRRNELKKQTETREVLKYYNEDFLDKNMYVCVALTIVFYALWTLEMPNSQISWTIPIFIILLMCYSLNVEGDSDGDPVEVILRDKILIGILILYAIFIFNLLYII